MSRWPNGSFCKQNYELAASVLADAETMITGRPEFDAYRLRIAWNRVMLHRWRGEASKELLSLWR